jgi:hypothetical protein
MTKEQECRFQEWLDRNGQTLRQDQVSSLKEMVENFCEMSLCAVESYYKDAVKAAQENLRVYGRG